MPSWDTVLDEDGVTYVAINATSDAWAKRSAESVKRYMPDMNITLFTDQHSYDAQSDCFNHTVWIPSRSDHPNLSDKVQYPSQGIIAKVTYMSKSPYQYNLFLDVDTYALAPLFDIFDVIKDWYDVAAVIDEAYMPVTSWADIPHCLPRYNSGVLAWRKNERTKQMFDLYWYHFAESEEDFTSVDEEPLAYVIHKSTVRIATLPPECNCRWIFPYILRHKAKILHGRSEDNVALGKKINAQVGTYRVMYEEHVIATYQPYVGFQLNNFEPGGES